MSQTPYNVGHNRIARLLGRLILAEEEKDVEVLLDHITSANRPHVISFLNAHAINLAWRDEIFYEAILSSDFIFRDGSGLFLVIVRPGCLSSCR